MSVARARVHFAEGRLLQAVSACADALSVEPERATALHLMGLIGVATGKPIDAARLIRGAINLSPAVAEFHNDLGAVLRALGQIDEAIAAFESAISLSPHWVKPHLSLGKLLHARGDHCAALQSFVRALYLAPDSAEAEYNVGVELLETDRPAEAEAYLRREVERNSEFLEAHFNLGVALHNLRKWTEAEACFRRVLEIGGTSVATLNQLAVTLAESRQCAEAESVLRQALQLEPSHPTTHTNLGNLFLQQDRFPEALQHIQQALELKPNSWEACNNRAGYVHGVALVRGDEAGLDEAERSYRQALKPNPNAIVVHMNLAMLLLSRGRFEEGWKEWECRRRKNDFPKLGAHRPAWEGESLEGRTILLHSEAGLGDTIHFARYAQLVQRRGARVILRCPKALRPLLVGCVGIDRLVTDQSDLPWYDVYAPLVSLPHLLGTVVDTIPADIPYIRANPDRVADWRRRLAEYSGMRVGISWQGNPNFKGDARRSFALNCMEPLVRVPGVQLFSLQTGPGQEQLAHVREWNVVDLGLPFAEKAAAMMNLDLVITCDTAVAHLAGALGRPVWTALSFMPDFRWLLSRSDTPWYPTMQLFRSPGPGMWRSVFETMAEHLEVNRPHASTGVTCQ